MTADDQTTPAAAVARLLQNARLRSRSTIGRGLLRLVRPYARRRSRQAAVAGTVARLEAEFEHVRKRHTEQIERLEDLVRELVLSSEALRRRVSAAESQTDQTSPELPRERRDD